MYSRINMVSYVIDSRFARMEKPKEEHMNEKSFYNSAFCRSKSLVKHDFDEGLISRRKSLIFASSVGILSSLVKVSGEVNVGVVKGTIESPILIYISIICVCFYFACWFYLECHKWSFIWYGEFRKRFLWAVSEMRVENMRLEVLNNQGVRFGELKVQRSDGISHFLFVTENPLRGNVRNEEVYIALEGYGFEVDRAGEQYKISYQYDTTELDEFYFHRFLRFYWYSCSYHAFIILFPFVLFSISVLSLSWRIYWHQIGG